MTPRTEIIAHRGASRERPENTVAAFVRAVELGADAAELDVHLTADGHLVVHHDPVVTGPPGRASVASLTLGALAEYRVRGEPIPSLDRVLASVGDRLRVYCELKGPGTAESALRAIGPLGERGAVHSFDHRMIATARRINPGVARGVLESAYHRDPCASMRDVDARDLWQNEALVDAALIEAVHAGGGRVIAWTVNRPERAAELASLGIDGICTDDVAGIAAALGR